MAKIINLDIPSLEMLLLIIFIFYLIFQVKTPTTLIEFINSNLGMIVILIVTVYLFLFTNPILGILSIFVVYRSLIQLSDTVDSV
jgi:predicted branched-subunit amino acid permease